MGMEAIISILPPYLSKMIVTTYSIVRCRHLVDHRWNSDAYSGLQAVFRCYFEAFLFQ